MRWRGSSSEVPPAEAPVAPASALDAAAYADGVADAGAGVPDPIAESGEGRQPAARLEVYGASVRCRWSRPPSRRSWVWTRWRG